MGVAYQIRWNKQEEHNRDHSQWVKGHNEKKTRSRGYTKNQLSCKCVTAGCLRCSTYSRNVTGLKFSPLWVCNLWFASQTGHIAHSLVSSASNKEQQRAYSSPTDSDYRLCSISCLINSTFEKLLYYDVFDSQGLMINLQRLLLALAKHRWYELWG